MTMLRLSDYLERPAIVQEKNRYQNFTITPIPDIVAWRAEQAKKLELLNLKREERKKHASEIISGPEAPLGELSWQGKVLIADPVAWEQKLQEAKWRRRKLFEPQKITETKSEWTYRDPLPPAESKTLGKRLTAWVKSIWDAATGS